MSSSNDTIAAISTPAGNGGIAVLRVSGESAIAAVDDFFSGNLSQAPSHRVSFGKFIYQSEIIDEVLITVFRAPQSYTGEDVVEISCHGSMFIAQQILEILLQKTRLAEAGEFTQRAFLNEKMGLTQAEAVGDLLMAKTKMQHLAAVQQLEGSLRQQISTLLQQIIHFRTLLELEIDFFEQDLEELSQADLLSGLEDLLAELKKLAATGKEGMILKEGLRISLVGAPNVGKSSIFNSFLQNERAIVTPVPGTTRDYLEEAIALQGYLVRIFDTAGLRTTENEVEKIGISRSYEIIKNSHKVLFIVAEDENETEYEKLSQLIEPSKICKVLNKSDLCSAEKISSFRKKNYLIANTISAEGLAEIKQNILSEINLSETDLRSGILNNSRQIAAAQKAISGLEKAIESLHNELGYEFTAFDLKEASHALEEIIGKVTDDDILNSIFSNFCIGK
ncbi:MAG: tRNA uridine-5-carboxymethylaminomethyl(34) synthesis GTPase MnmE [Candidatus Cloacimonadales bacterium]